MLKSSGVNYLTIIQLWLGKLNIVTIILNFYLVQNLNNKNNVHLTKAMQIEYAVKKFEVCEEEIIDRFSERYLERFRKRNNTGCFILGSADHFCFLRHYDG